MVAASEITRRTSGQGDRLESPFLGRTFTQDALLQIAMPLDGIGAGCSCLNGCGGFQDFSIHHQPTTTALPAGRRGAEAAFAVLHVEGAQPLTLLVEGPLPAGKIYDQGVQAQGYGERVHDGFPRFENL